MPHRNIPSYTSPAHINAVFSIYVYVLSMYVYVISMYVYVFSIYIYVLSMYVDVRIPCRKEACGTCLIYVGFG